MNRILNLLMVVAVVFLAFGSNPRAVMRFMDRFEYAVDRSDAGASAIFRQAGWSGAKTQQSANANGYLYTTTSIPGYNGPFPGLDSSRVLAIEALPGSMQGQTDFYLQLGDGTLDDYIPGDVWFQFWIYPQNYGAQSSTYSTRNKFLYVCNDSYPCHSHLWMIGQGSQTYNPHLSTPLGDPARGDFFWNLAGAAGASRITYAPAPAGDQDQLGQHDLSDWMRANRWTLVKMHFNTTATSGNSWEVWLRPHGGSWRKVSEWIGGRTPGFTWNIPSGSVGGHRMLRMPTTVGGPSAQWNDYWMYMDDFAMATAERDLPVYPDDRFPRAPTNLRIVPEGALLISPATILKQLSVRDSSGRNGG